MKYHSCVELASLVTETSFLAVSGPAAKDVNRNNGILFFFFNHQLFSHKSSKTSVVLVGIKAADELGLDEVTVSL